MKIFTYLNIYIEFYLSPTNLGFVLFHRNTAILFTFCDRICAIR